MVVRVSLQRNVVHEGVAFNESLVRLSVLSLDWRSVQVDLRVDHEKRVVGIDHVIVD